MSNPVLEVKDLKKYFITNDGLLDTIFRREKQSINAVDDVSFSVAENEVVGVIGESGCGKSTLLKTLIGIHEPTGGDVLFRGNPMSEFDKQGWKEYRRNVQIIFQDPFESLDPKMTVRESLMEPLHVHDIEDKEERIREVLENVDLQPAEQYLDQYPRHLSGGEKQRVAIGRALTVEPELILADEPVSMLDVSTQAAILNTLSSLIRDTGVSMIYISHDISTVSYVCDRINVMYLGRMVESAPTLRLLEEPEHPYSRALVEAVPIPDPRHERNRTELEGSTPDPVNLGEGCRFKDRCPERMEICDIRPQLAQTSEGREVACHLHYEHDKTAYDDDGPPADNGTSDSTTGLKHD